MINRIIQTFWSGPSTSESALKITSGWLAPEYNWMSWSLSCLLLRRHYDEVELYTDEVGKSILIDLLQLPYTKVHISFDKSFKIHPKLFSLAKIHSYSLQEEPFIHVDGDIYMWKPFQESLLRAELISSNIEKNLFFNLEILKEVEQHFNTIPTHLKGVGNHKDIFASNAGIIGGSNIDFIKLYCKKAVDFIKENREKLHLINTGGLNYLIEQISFYYLSIQEQREITYCVERPVEHPLYEDFWRFVDVPNVTMVHPVGGCKKIHYVLDHLARRLRFEFPETYYNILGLCKRENSTLTIGLYNYLKIKPKEHLNNPESFLKAIDTSIDTLLKIDFEAAFKRTIQAIQLYHSITIKSHKELLNIINDDRTPAQLKELYMLDEIRMERYSSMISKVKKGKIYGIEKRGYENCVNFQFSKTWSENKIALNSGAILLNLKWNWRKFYETPSQSNLDKVLNDEVSNFYIALTNNIMNLEIQETYHEGIDEVILKCLENENYIRNLVLHARDYFEDDINVENLEYQRLLFDTIKRLLFQNIVEII